MINAENRNNEHRALQLQQAAQRLSRTPSCARNGMLAYAVGGCGTHVTLLIFLVVAVVLIIPPSASLVAGIAKR